MLNRSQLYKYLSVALLFSLVVATTPLSASDFSSKSVLGSVSAVGTVDLRGAQIPDEATVFSGDRLTSGAGAYAKVLLANGQKVEVAANTALKFAGQAGSLDIELQSGTVAFSSVLAAPVRIVVGVYEITSSQPLSGNLGFLGADFVDLKVLTGSASVRNLKTKQTYVVLKNQERMFGLKTLDMMDPLAQVAFNVPQPIPQTQTSSGSHKGLWIAAAAAGAGGIIALAVLNNNSSTPAVSTTAATLTVTSALTTAAAAQTADTQLSTATTQAPSAINAAQNLPPATKTTLTTQAANLSAAAAASQTQIASLQTQLNSLQSQLKSASGSQVTAIQNQINSVTQSLNTQVANLNNLIGQLNSLIASAVAAGVPNVPSVVIQPIPPATTSSASVIP